MRRSVPMYGWEVRSCNHLSEDLEGLLDVLKFMVVAAGLEPATSCM